MAYTVPLHSRAKVDGAGDTLIGVTANGGPLFDYELDQALSVINNWRSCHRYPLNAIQVTVRGRAKTVDSSVIVPQRLKRMAAIAAKLQLHSGMKLSRMHDIGGCRAILRNVNGVRKLLEKCRVAASKNPNRGARLIREYNYMDGCIPGPKSDGYRGIHLVYQYRSTSEAGAQHNGLRIEVQIRSQLQHALATAVETASIFTEQPIKSIKANLHDDRWRRFFALMGNALAIRERTTLIPGLPTDRKVLSEEIRELSEALAVENVLTGWGATVEHLSGHPKGAKTFLLRLDTETKITEVIAYSENEIPKTDEQYLELEKAYKDKPSQQVVLVDVESIDALRIGYPNFYLNTGKFIEAMKRAITYP
jgi:hypothetical protein